MSQLVITLRRVTCDGVTDDFLEGLSDEFGWRLIGIDEAGGLTTVAEEIPMPGMEAVEAGTEHVLDRELARLGPGWPRAALEFWDHDTFSQDDLLGRIEIERDGRGGVTATAGEAAQTLGNGSFRLTGQQGDYRIWLAFEER